MLQQLLILYTPNLFSRNILELSAHCRENTDLFLHCKDIAPARDEFGLLVSRSKFYLVYKPVNDPHIYDIYNFAECFWNLEKPECDEDEEIESDSCLPESDWAKV